MKTALALFLMLVTVISLTSCKEEGDTINVRMDYADYPDLDIDTVAGYLLVPGVPIPLRATAYYSYQSQQDWTSLVTWSVSDTQWATISATGVLTPKRTGSGEVQAVSPDSWIARRTFLVREIESLQLSITDPIILRGDTTTVSIVAQLSGGYVRDVRAVVPVTWASTSPNVADVSDDWTLRGLATGQTALTATISGVSTYPNVLTVDSVLTLTVEEASTGPYLPMDSVVVSATMRTLISGLLPAEDRVSWTISDPTHFLQVGAGTFVPVIAGNFSVSASLGGRSSQNLAIEVWNVTALHIVPEIYPDTLVRGDTLQFSALANVQGHGQVVLTNEVQWTSTDSQIGGFVAPGLFVPRGMGTVIVQAHVALITSNAVAVNCSIPYVFAEGFETYPLGNFSGGELWDTYYYGSYDRIAISDVAASGAKSLMIVDSGYYDYAWVELANPSFNAVAQGNFYFRVRTNGSGLSVFIGSGPSGSQAAVELWWYNNQIYANDGGSLQFLQAFSPDAWYSIRVEFDCADDRYNIYVDDDLGGSTLDFFYSQPAIDFIRFEASSSSIGNQTYVDDVILDDL